MFSKLFPSNYRCYQKALEASALLLERQAAGTQKLQEDRDINPKGNPITAFHAFIFFPILQRKNWVNDRFLSFILSYFQGSFFKNELFLQHSDILALVGK